MTPNRSFLAGLTVVGAFVIGRYLAPEPPAPLPAQTVIRDGARPTVVREIVREREVDRAQPEAREQPSFEQPSPEQASPEQASPEAAAKHAAALDKARVIVGAAVSARVWTKVDAQALVEVLPSLDRDGATEVMTALIAPINAGQLKVETSGSLLDPT